MLLSSALILGCFIALTVYLLSLRKRQAVTGPSLPPGPKGLPVIGNLLQLPSELLFLKLTEWSKQYGPIYSYDLAGRPIVVLSGVKEACDLLDRMSAKTSGRAGMIKVSEYLTHNMLFGFNSRGDFWRTRRRAAHETLNVRAATDFCPMQEEEARVLLEGFLLHPEIEVAKHIHREASSVAWRALFGGGSIPLDGPDPTTPIEAFFHEICVASVLGGSIVDIFPFLNPIISRSKWLRRQSDKLYNDATSFFVRSFCEPEADEMRSLSRRLKESGHRIGMEAPYDCGWLAANLFMAAQETTATALRWFFVAMLTHPGAAEAARAELDAVVGNRPPTFADWHNLPQMEALLKELLRWRSPTPLGFPHMATEDIIYNGYLIPNGAMIISNTWAICRDQKLYDHPEQFDPTRFLDKNGRIKQAKPDSHDDYLSFGHGRRVCIGKSFAINHLWITIAHLLWAFEIKPVLDKNGAEIIPDPLAFLDYGSTTWPKPFNARLVPRSPDLAEQLRASFHV